MWTFRITTKQLKFSQLEERRVRYESYLMNCALDSSCIVYCNALQCFRYGLVKTFTALAVVAGGTMSYAKFDPEFREWLNNQVPYSSDAINVLFQEDKTFSDRFDQYLESIQNW